MTWPVNPLRGKTTNWRAVCGRSACTVRREGGSTPIGSPYPYRGNSSEETCHVRSCRDPAKPARIRPRWLAALRLPGQQRPGPAGAGYGNEAGRHATVPLHDSRDGRANQAGSPDRDRGTGPPTRRQDRLSDLARARSRHCQARGREAAGSDGIRTPGVQSLRLESGRQALSRSSAVVASIWPRPET